MSLEETYRKVKIIATIIAIILIIGLAAGGKKVYDHYKSDNPAPTQTESISNNSESSSEGGK